MEVSKKLTFSDEGRGSNKVNILLTSYVNGPILDLSESPEKSARTVISSYM